MGKRTMKFVVVTTPDGIRRYVESTGKAGSITVTPAKALLFDHLQEASAHASARAIRTTLYLKSEAWKKKRPGHAPLSDAKILAQAVHWVEVVEDEAGFRASEDDTW